MKPIILIAAIIIFCSCGKQYDYECTIHSPTAIDKVQKRFTEAQAERFERRNSKNGDRNDFVVEDGETETHCEKK